jgi:GxxExxY protein
MKPFFPYIDHREKIYAEILNLKIMTENEISFKVIGAALSIHKSIGPGLLESAYENALAYDLKEMGLDVMQQVPMPFIYKKVKQEVGYRIDLLVNNKIIIEIKAVEALVPVHYAQLLTYLKLSDLKLGLLINFNSKILKDNIHRIVNNL